jgi:hypothetical protein
MQIVSGRRASYLLLCFSPILMAAVWSTRLLGAPIVRYWSAGVLILAMLSAAWTLGARTTVSVTPERRRLAVVGGLLVAVWSSLALIGVLGTPDQATIPENKLRYLVLLVDTIVIASALMILRDTLKDAGERFYSALGFAAAVLAGPSYIFFTLVQQLLYRAVERAGSAQLLSGDELPETLSLGMLFVGATLTYLASAAFAAALASCQWLGRRAAGVYIGASLFALVCVGVRVGEALLTSDGPMWGFNHWYSFPGFVLVIPAVPWLMFCFLGVSLLRRAGYEQP